MGVEWISSTKIKGVFLFLFVDDFAVFFYLIWFFLVSPPPSRRPFDCRICPVKGWVVQKVGDRRRITSDKSCTTSVDDIGLRPSRVGYHPPGFLLIKVGNGHHSWWHSDIEWIQSKWWFPHTCTYTSRSLYFVGCKVKRIFLLLAVFRCLDTATLFYPLYPHRNQMSSYI